MNILYLTNHLNVGGISSYILSLSSALKTRGHNVYVASSGGELLGEFLEKGVIYIPIPIRTKQEVSPKILFSMFKLSKLNSKNNIDIVHSNSRTTQVLGCLLGSRLNIPHIFTCHGFFKKRFFRRVFPCWGNKIVAISKEVKEHLINDFKVKEEDIRVIHNGIDIEKFRKPITDGSTTLTIGTELSRSADNREPRKKDLGLGSGPVVGIIARLSDVKGHIYLIEAMSRVLKDIPDAQLFIVGEGKMKTKLLLLARRLGIGEKVFFIPSVSDTRGVLSVMDLFVMPSLEEGLGLSLMEAMAAGRAVIGSDVGGIKSLIRDNSNGLLVKPQDINALTLAILNLLKDPEKRKIMGNNARDFISRNFSQEQMVSLTEEVYQECVDAKH